MISGNYYIIQQKDSSATKKEDAQNFNHKNHKKDSALKGTNDSLKTHNDTLLKKKLGTKMDTLQIPSGEIADSTQQTVLFTKHMDLIPLKTRFIFTEIPKFKVFDITTVTTQKYTCTKVKNVYFPGKTYLRPTTDWMIVVGVVSLIVLGWVYGFFKKFLSQLFQSAYDDKVSYKLMEERSSITERVSFALNILFVLNSGLFIFEIMSVFKISIPGISGFPLFALLSGTLTIIYLFKYILYYVLGIILNASWVTSEIIHSIFLYSKIFGIFLIPIVVLIPFIEVSQAQYLAYIGVLIFAISFLFRIFRGFQISMKINFSISYLILYLCAFEILPLLIIGKFFYKLINS